MPLKEKNCRPYISLVIDKSYLPEYISSNSSPGEEVRVKEELLDIAREDEVAVIKYLLDVMRKHDIITETEYRDVFYKYG